MAMSDRSIPGAEDATEQIAKLRAQVETLMRERVSPTLNQVRGQAETAYGVVRDQADMIGGRVKDRPLIAILTAVAIGYVVGRILR